MTTDLDVTKVVFRIFHGEVIALMPYQIESGTSVLSYQHIGQHSGADYQHCIANSKPAKESEYKDLLKELTDIGYNVSVIQKYSHREYLKAYYLNN